MIQKILEKAQKPSPEFRGAPFWAWNSKLEPEELRRQIRTFHEMGLGGFFMHPRVGLNTPYLGNDYFNCVKACVDEAEKLNMKPWLYDEDRWPSGAAGGLVTKNPEFRMRFLTFEEIGQSFTVNDPEDERTLAFFALEFNGETLQSYRRLENPGDNISSAEKRVRFYRKCAIPDSWYNNQTYLDTMNETAVDEFIRITHEAYKRELGSKIGASVPGIFTDEPGFYHHSGIANDLPWTDRLPEEFRKNYGYDLLDHLPELYNLVNEKRFACVRLHYYDLLTHLFVNAFGKKIGTWCKENNMMFTGHVMAEDTLISQAGIVGSAMRFYEYMQAPGIDLLTEYWNIFTTAKQCTSMAHQFGRQWRLSETYGCTGWDFSFAGHKALGDWQYAMGINFRCQHLAWYSMEAQAKRDYPASISYQSPWYRQYGIVEDYFARLGAALSEGEEQRDLLVIHPIESTWGTRIKFEKDEDFLRNESRILGRIDRCLLSANIDYDYGEEEVMSRHTKVGKDEKGAFLSVGAGTYRAVLIPELRTIRKTTLNLLQAFKEAGGTVVYLDGIPACLDGIESDEPATVYRQFVFSGFADAVSKLEHAARRVSICDAAGHEIGPALYLLRKQASLQTLFLCNTGMEIHEIQQDGGIPPVSARTLKFNSVTVTIRDVAPDSTVYEYDLTNGRLWKVPFAGDKNSIRFQTSLDVIGSHLFFITPEKLNAPEHSVEKFSPGNLLQFAPEWEFSLDDPNVFLLDEASASVDGEKFSTKQFILNLDGELRMRLGAPRRGGHMAQPWLNATAPVPEKQLELLLKYEFECGEIPAKDCALALERPDLYEIEFNGKTLKKQELGFWCDRSMRTLHLPAGMFQKERNTLLLKSKYHEFLPGLEAIFILGEFGVYDGHIEKLPDRLECGDVCLQGLSNYAGNLIYRTKFTLPKTEKPVYLSLGEWKGTALGVRLNDSGWTLIAWPPYEMNLAPFLKDGENELEIQVFGNRRNSHGPFYTWTPNPSWHGPGNMADYLHEDRYLVPLGLLTPPEIRY